MFSKNVFCGATKPLRPPGIFDAVFRFRLRFGSIVNKRSWAGFKRKRKTTTARSQRITFARTFI